MDKFFMAGWLIFICAFETSWLRAQDWTQWRGDDRSGVISGTTLPDTLPREMTSIWSRPVDPGLSSPLLVGDQIFLLTRKGDEEVISARSFDDGRELWSIREPAPFVPNQQATNPNLFPESRGLGPFATPAWRNGILITLGVNRMLSAVDTENGTLLWRHRLRPAQLPDKIVFECPPCGMECDGKEYDQGGACPNASCPLQLSAKGLETTASYDGAGGNYYGAAASPLIEGDLVVINVGNSQSGQVSAFELESGRERWRYEGQAVSSSSPITAELDGVRQLIVLSRTSIEGLSLDDGEVLWSHPLASNAQIVTPIVYRNLVIFSGYQRPTTALRVSLSSGGWQVDQAWENTEITLYTSTPVLIDGVLYGLSYSGRGRLFAIDAASGQLTWSTPGREGNGAAILATAERLLILLDSGELRVVDIDPAEYRLLASYSLSESPVWAHPVLRDKRLLVKNESELILYEFR